MDRSSFDEEIKQKGYPPLTDVTNCLGYKIEILGDDDSRKLLFEKIDVEKSVILFLLNELSIKLLNSGIIIKKIEIDIA